MTAGNWWISIGVPTALYVLGLGYAVCRVLGPAHGRFFRVGIVFTSDGKFGSLSSSADFARFQDDCRKAKVGFRLYAVDNAVVWQALASAPAAEPSPASR
ncbi:hypothetical protein [Burkholderia gladioli]|uniref:hypothetical protein n=1 Tax=Burkholderia gladioli TaxID=28095 RepID=UPI000AC0E4E9|nr:hypothetical protein [Burkholderia gladioli]